MTQRKMTQYCSQYIRPPTFAPDSSDSEAPDPFAYVPLSQTGKSKKRKSPMSSTYARVAIQLYF